MVDESKASTLEGLKATQKFLQSLGRFGNTPFLWPMYGAGELPQAFCRLCAVFGGTYFLGRSIQGLVVDKNSAEVKVKAVMSEGKRLNVTKALVLGASICPEKILAAETTSEAVLDRQVTLRSDSISPSQKEQLSFVSLPAKRTEDEDSGNKSNVYYQEVGNGAAACPREMYCLQATRSLRKDEGQVQDLCKLLVPEQPDQTLWSLRYQMRSVEVTAATSEVASNVRVCSDPRFELDYDLAIDSARQIFASIYPDDEFLPRAPEPEEIVLPGGEEPQTEDKPEESAEDNAREGEADIKQEDDKNDAQNDEPKAES